MSYIPIRNAQRYDYIRPNTYPVEWTREALTLLGWMAGIVVAGCLLNWYLNTSIGLPAG